MQLSMKELGEYFDDIPILMEVYTKLHQSPIFHSEDGSTWFFIAFKKNYLVDKSTIITKSHNDNFIASKLFPEEGELEKKENSNFDEE